MSRLVLFNKPFNTLCQFSSDNQDQPTLKNYIDIPEIYPAGRLDRDSEGLVLLTDDGKLQAHIAHPQFKMPKTYFVQVDGVPTEEDLMRLRNGIILKDGQTRPAKVQMTEEPSWLWSRFPPVRYRANIPTSWIKLTITEGKNRQVRRMTAAIDHPTLRLIRHSIGSFSIDNLDQGRWSDSPKDLLAALQKDAEDEQKTK